MGEIMYGKFPSPAFARGAGSGLSLLAAILALASPALATCPGDCNGDGEVRITELVLGVSIGLGAASFDDCPAFDQNDNDRVTIDEVVAGVEAGLEGCRVPTAGIVFSGEANRLNAYDPSDGFLKQTVIERAASDPENGRDINGQICFTRGEGGALFFIAGEDTGQSMGIRQGWGYFRLEGEAVGEFSATQLGKLAPTYQTGDDNAENFGCGFLSDGRLLTTDVGSQAVGPANGQLIVWFPPFDVPDPAYCKIDTAIGTAQQIAIDDQDRVYVASSRVDVGVFRYSGPFPTSNDAAGGCGREDSTGAPLADEGLVGKEKLFSDPNLPTVNGLLLKPGGGYYAGSVLNGVIAEFDQDGGLVRRILEPPAGSMLPFPSGSPMALGLASDGTLYYADLGLTVGPGSIGPGRDLGTVRRIRFFDGEPLAPETMDRGLNFPDGIGILEE